MELTSDFYEEVGMSNEKLSWLHHEQGKRFQHRFCEKLLDYWYSRHLKDRGNPFEDKTKQLVTVCT